MMEINLVKTKNQIEKNINTLESYIKSSDSKIKQQALSYIRRGHCFLVYEYANRLHFCPSRFAGYIDNSIELHEGNENRDGKETNPAISDVLGIKPKPNADMEHDYGVYWQSLSIDEVSKIKRKYWRTNIQINNISLTDVIITPDDVPPDDKDTFKTEAMRYYVTRVGQSKFREGVLSAFCNRCCLSGITESRLLIASHIKPWRDANNRERLDPLNGLCLYSGYDVLFDNGYFTIDDNGTVQVTQQTVCQETRKILERIQDKIIHFHTAIPVEYLSYHRKSVFMNG